MSEAKRGYADLHEHLEALERRGLLLRVDRPIDKDAEMHPLVRWQFVGGLDEEQRKAFLFTNVIDGLGRPYALRVVEEAVCHEVVVAGDALLGEGHGLDALPIPISTPGFDSAPTLTATNVITRDPVTGVQNMGTYRAALKAPDRLVVRMATRAGGAGGYLHYLEHQRRGDKTMPCAIVLGCPPSVAFLGLQKLPIGVDEMGVAGGLAGAPIKVVRARTIDLLVPAEAEVVIEGLIDTEYVE